MAPITLTLAQFNKTAAAKKPGASYAGYRKYIARKRGTPLPGQTQIGVPDAQPATLDSILGSYQASMPTVAQQAALAHQSVADQIKLAVAQANVGSAAQLKANAAQAKTAQGFALALANLQSGNGDQTRQNWLDAADRIKSLGGGLTGSVAAAQNAEAAKSAADVARLTGGVGAASGLDVGGLSNAARMSGVVIPGTSLVEQANNAVAAAKARDAVGQQNVENVAQSYLAKNTDLRTDIASKIAALQLTRPDLYRQAIESQRSGARQDMATLVSALALQNTQANTTSEIQNRATTAATGRAKVTGLVPGTRKPAAGYYIDAGGVPQKLPTGFQIKNGKLVPLPAKPGSQTTVTKNVQAIIDKSQKTISGVLTKPPYTNPPSPFLKGIDPSYTPLLPYATARQKLLQYVPPTLRKDPRVLAMIDDQLQSVGYKKGK